MVMAAVNITARELAYDVETFEDLIRSSKTPFISSNIVGKESGLPRYPTHVIIDRNDKQIAIIGVTGKVIKTWKLSNGKALVITDPIASVKAVMEKARKKADVVILLAHMPRRKMQSFVEALPGIDIVLAGDGYSLTQELLEINNTLISYTGKQGQYLGSLKVQLTDSGVTVLDHEMINLLPELPEDKNIKAIVDQVIAKIEHDFAEIDE